MNNNIGGTYFMPKMNHEKRGPLSNIKTVSMNYKANEPTEVGRIYKTEDLKKAFDKALENKEVPIVRNSSELYRKNENGIYIPVICFKDIIGFFIGYEIKEDGEIRIKVKPLIDTGLFDGTFSVCTGIVGTVREDTSVDISSLVGFFLVGDIDIINKKGKIVERVKREEIVNELVILTGNIGSGKSTFARELVTNNKDCIVVNDDAITTMIGGGDYTNYDKSKKYLYKCIELYCVEAGLGSNRSVVVDMPNMNRSSRRRFIEIGKQYNANIISYDWGSGKIEGLTRRLKNPRGYNNWEEAFYTKKNKYEQPSTDEGFDKIIRIRS